MSDLPFDHEFSGEWNSWCPTCKAFFRQADWEPVIVTCEFGTEHFGERCPRCRKVRVLLEPHELRPEPDADLEDRGD